MLLEYSQKIKDIIKYTKRPKYVHQIVDDFFELHSLDKSNYLAIRWDFEKDFSDSCEKKKDDFFCNLTSNSTDAFRGSARLQAAGKSPYF
jgi:hypothetical protein